MSFGAISMTVGDLFSNPDMLNEIVDDAEDNMDVLLGDCRREDKLLQANLICTM